MSTASTIADYIRHKRSLGIRFDHGGHIRLLIPLAFTPPQTLAAIVAGSGSTDLTVTALSQAIPYAWRS